MNRPNIFHLIPTLALGITVFLFWAVGHPAVLAFHEQNQLFLFSLEYLTSHLSVAGGLCSWISEFIVQFYFYPWAGALLIAILMSAMQLTSCALIRRLNPESKGYISEWSLSMLPPLASLWAMGNHDLLLSYPVSIEFVLLATWLYVRFFSGRATGTAALLAAAVTIPLVYWSAGTVSALYVLMLLLLIFRSQRGWVPKCISAAALLSWSALCLYASRTVLMAQYPWKTVLLGIDYERNTILFVSAPDYLWIIPVLIGIALLIYVMQPRLGYVVPLAALLYGGFTYTSQYDRNVQAMMEVNLLLRQSDWAGLIERIDQWKEEDLEYINDESCINAQNLALAKLGRLSSDMFQYPQIGMHGLLLPWRKNFISDIATMEAFWQLGFINESLRYAFDTQESIPNCRQSGRFITRMVECYIVNGRYEIAAKHLLSLKKTLFYRHWAEQAELCLGNDKLVNRHPVWSLKRQQRLQNDFLYYYPEMDKMLGQLVLQDRQNSLAINYYMAALLLQGKVNEYASATSQTTRPEGISVPAGYQEFYQYMKNRMSNGTADASTGASTPNR